jgi:hypothetical protein
MTSFREHVQRMTSQYNAIRQLRENLPKNQVTAQMDFAENYSCGHLEEEQSAYFEKTQITVHPVVVHLDNEEGERCHKSYVMVTNERSHNAIAVLSFMKKLIVELKLLLPDLEMIHYLTDSPTSQYRNRLILNVIAHHQQLFGVPASWQYFEAGHGKGPCDGVGGSVKRMADMAVKRQQCVIQNAEDFVSWGNSQEKKTVKYILVTEGDIKGSKCDLNKMVVKPVKGKGDHVSPQCVSRWGREDFNKGNIMFRLLFHRW